MGTFLILAFIALMIWAIFKVFIWAAAFIISIIIFIIIAITK